MANNFTDISAEFEITGSKLNNAFSKLKKEMKSVRRQDANLMKGLLQLENKIHSISKMNTRNRSSGKKYMESSGSEFSVPSCCKDIEEQDDFEQLLETNVLVWKYLESRRDSVDSNVSLTSEH